MRNEETIWEDYIVQGFPEGVYLHDFQTLPKGFVVAVFSRPGEQVATIFT